MDKKAILLIILLAIVVIGALLAYMSQGLMRTYKKGIQSGIERTAGTENGIITEDDIKSLPNPVQDYLRYVGVIGKEKVKNMKMVADAEMKLDPKKDYAKFQSEQYNFFESKPTRLFTMKTKMFGLPIIGLHSYTEEKAQMLIKLAGIVPVLDAKGPEMRISDTTTLFNDMCSFAPATLIDKRIQWEEIDNLSAKASFEAFGCKISAVLFFNEEGQLINFVSNDRYYMPMDGSSQKLTWSTPMGNYQDRNGFRLATYGEAKWSFPEGDYCYAKFTNIKEVKYNCNKLE